MTLEQVKQILQQAHAIAPEQTEVVLIEVHHMANVAGKRVVRVLGCLRALADALTVDE